MENKKLDRRVIKTKKAIRNAYAELLTQKNTDNITIKDISNLADINRKTFYNHYNGIYEIIDEIENEIVSTFDNILEIDINRDLNNPYNIFFKLSTIINKDIDFYSHLLRTDSNSNLVSKIAVILKAKISDSFLANAIIDKEKLDIAVEFIIFGMLAVYRNWFNSDRMRSIEEVANTISILAVSGVNGILNNKNIGEK